MHRAEELAEHIINLRDIEGIEAPLHQLATSDIESAYAELQSAKLLRMAGTWFKFVNPNGVAKESYDFPVQFPNGAEVCADAKCKLETNDFNIDGYVESLRAASGRNLPANRPGAVLVKIPQEWAQSPDLLNEIVVRSYRFVGGSNRVVAIIVYASLTGYERLTFFQQFQINEVPKITDEFGFAGPWLLFRGDPLRPNPIGWRRLNSYFY